MTKRFRLQLAYVTLIACAALLLPALGSAKPRPRADLTVSSVARVSGVVLPGNSLFLRHTVRNAGKASAKPSRTRFYLSRDARKSRNDVALKGSRRVGRLKPGGRSRRRTKIGVPDRKSVV